MTSDDAYHYGDGPAGNTQHKGKREDCPAPDCAVVDDVCNGYPEHRRTRETYRGDDGIQWECLDCDAEGWEPSDGIELGTREVRRVAFIGQPGAGKTATASCCGGEPSDGTVEEEIFELPGFVGMIHGGKADLSRYAKDIARGRMRADGIVTGKRIGKTSLKDDVEEALRRLEEGPTMPSFSPAVCKCPTGCACRGRPVDGSL